MGLTGGSTDGKAGRGGEEMILYKRDKREVEEVMESELNKMEEE